MKVTSKILSLFISLLMIASASSVAAGAVTVKSCKSNNCNTSNCVLGQFGCGECIDVNSLFNTVNGLCAGGNCKVITGCKKAVCATQPAAKPAQSTAKPSQKRAECTSPSTSAAKKPAKTVETPQATKPVQCTSEPAEKATEPTREAAKPEKQTQPVKETTQPATKPAASSVEASEFNTAYEDEVIRLVNIERAAYGLSALAKDDGAAAAAHIRAKEITESFSHTRPDGTSCFTVANELGVSYRSAGENIAYGYPSPQQVVNGWMNSAGHRRNILSSSFNKIGVGCYSKGGVMYWSQFFIYSY